jgi:hypothetical protein
LWVQRFLLILDQTAPPPYISPPWQLYKQ